MAVAVLLLLQVAIASAAKCSTGFSVVAPEVAVPGKTTAVLVTLHGRAEDGMLDPLNVTVRLETQDEDNVVKLLTTASQMITGYGIIPLKIPSSPASHCTLHTTVGCVGNEECTAKSHSVIRLLGPVRDVIVRPARHHYRPGETITFWILALDHDLRLVRGELAYVALSDPAGTKVAIWEQLSMDEGVRKLSAILANGARAGTWRIEARCGGGSARVDISVGANAGSSASAAPAAEQHYVELRFADSMRRRYKPGLPFVGRVEAMSTEKRVRVRVKLYDDKTDIYSQDIDMSTGEGGFIVPTVMADAPYVNLQKLPARIRTSFEERFGKDTRVLPTFAQLLELLDEQCRFQSTVQEQTRRAQVSPEPKEADLHRRPNRAPVRRTPVNQVMGHSEQQVRCSFCHSTAHGLYKCKEFSKMSASSRKAWARKSGHCYRCLRKHYASSCTHLNWCRHCNSEDHNTLLCSEEDIPYRRDGGRSGTSQPHQVRAQRSDAHQAQAQSSTHQGRASDQGSVSANRANQVGTSAQPNRLARTVTPPLELELPVQQGQRQYGARYNQSQAELVAVEGKEIETHYVLARERIRRWNSTSKCYLLVENLPTPLQAGGIASASVWSSCGCRQRLLAAVTSGGRAVHWAAVPAPSPANDTDLCRFNYTFPVTADMAPVSSLLVYYVTEIGEPVSDVASFHVRLLHKEVAVAVEERRWWYPRASLQLRVLAPPDSTMCLIGARAPPDAKFDPHQTTSEHEEQPGPEFVSAGVSLFVGGGACGGGVLYRQRSAPAPRPPPQLVPPASHDRLWMWKCFNYTTQLSTDGVTISAPSEAGRWSLWALSLSNRGLRFSAPRTINVFRPIQLDFALPPALKVGETVEVDVKITNNINNCMDVTALLALSAGAAFASTGALYVTERLRLGPRGGTQLVVRVAVNTPGRKNITVEVTGYSADNCSVSYTSFNNETLVGSVIRSASVLVLPEGLHRSDTQSAYFCANEHLAVSSRGSWEWQWVAAPRNRAGLVLELKSQGAAHVALSGIKAPSDDMYRVVFEKSRVWIAKGKHGYDVHLASAEQTEGDEECSGSDSWCAWWLWWEGGRLSVGRGAAPSERRLLVWPLAQEMRIKYVGFSAMWGDKADFRIWNFNEEAGFSQVLELGLPHGVVPGSASGTLLISGGLHLPLYSFQTDSSDQWAEVWRDSQLSAASASLAPLLALEFIPHLVEEAEREKILKKLPEQVQVLLSFRKSDNSFSDHPGVSSHLSTVKILEILSKIQSYYPIDPDLFKSIKKWIQKRQNADGSFTPLEADKEVDYYPVEMRKINGTEQNVDVNEYYYYDKDGNMTKADIEWERRVEVTAETLTALLEVGVENQMDADVATKAQVYLEKNLHNLTSPAALAATVLALVLARSPIVPEALTILRNASTTEEGEFGWPAPRRDAADWLLEETSRNIKTTSYEAVTMEQYVAGVRVLLAACARGALAEGEAAARFLYYRASTLQRHPSLAYSATKAAAQYAALAHDRHRALTVSLATAGMELTDTLELRAKTPPRPLQLPGLPTKVFVYATGAGCATVQGTIAYSTYTPKPENTLLNIQAGIIEEIRPERSSIEDLQGNLPTLIIKTCFKWKGKERSGILRLESSLFSGYELHSVNPVVLDGATFADLHYGSRGESVWFVFANISSTCPVCVTYEARSKFIITSLRPAFAKIYPSTRPDLAVETFFHARPSSPLLRGITDDDFITWFDKTELASLKTASNIDNICECGRICSRDYEFRKEIKHLDKLEQATNEETNMKVDELTTKKFEEKSPITTTERVKVTTTKVMTTVKELSSHLLKTKEPNETSLNNSETKTAVESITTIQSISTAQSVTDAPKQAVTHSDDPIIVPTATYTNRTNESKIENNIVPIIPKTNGELIVQKILVPKTSPKKEDFKKKPLSRRKGTLKATYGDKHDKFFEKVKLMNHTDLPTNKTFNPEKKIKTLPQKVVFTKSKTILVPKLTDIKINEDPHNENKSIDIKPSNSSKDAHNKYSESVPNNVSKHEHLHGLHSETASSSHVIAAITNTNIKNIHYRTKKPKAMTQIKKPVINNTHSDVKPAKNSTHSEDKINKTKMKSTATEKYAAKVLKSINKEIHKIPATPISETSKTLSEAPKPDIAPENRGGFEILDKNRLWELLKEGSEIDPSKVEDKVQVHNKLILAQNVSNTNNSRSL